MRREEAIARLKAAEPDIRARGVESLYLFGSVARDEAQSDSDRLDAQAELESTPVKPAPGLDL